MTVWLNVCMEEGNCYIQFNQSYIHTTFLDIPEYVNVYTFSFFAVYRAMDSPI